MGLSVFTRANLCINPKRAKSSGLRKLREGKNNISVEFLKSPFKVKVFFTFKVSTEKSNFGVKTRNVGNLLAKFKAEQNIFEGQNAVGGFNNFLDFINFGKLAEF